MFVKNIIDMNMDNEGIKRMKRDAIQGITKSAIQRMAYKAGAIRLSGLVYEEIRGVLRVHLEKLLKVALAFMEHEERKTISDSDVRAALKYLCRPNAHAPLQTKKVDEEGKKINESMSMKRCSTYLTKLTTARGKRHEKSEEDKVVHHAHPGTLALRQIKYYQKQDGCYCIPHASFARLLKDLIGHSENGLRLTSGAIHMIHLDAEKYLVTILEDANLSAFHARRKGIMPKDIQLTRRVLREH